MGADGEFLLATIDVTCASHHDAACRGRDHRHCDVARCYFAYALYYWRFSSMGPLWKFVVYGFDLPLIPRPARAPRRGGGGISFYRWFRGDMGIIPYAKALI